MRNPLSSESFVPLQVARHHFSLTAFRMFCCLQFFQKCQSGCGFLGPLLFGIYAASQFLDLCVFLQVGKFCYFFSLKFICLLLTVWVFVAAHRLQLQQDSYSLAVGARASHCSGFFCHEAWALGHSGSVVVARATQIVASWLVESSQTRHQTQRVPCTDRQILNCQSGKSTSRYFSNSFFSPFQPPSGILIAQMLDPR